jgi:hypothetical protein
MRYLLLSILVLLVCGCVTIDGPPDIMRWTHAQPCDYETDFFRDWNLCRENRDCMKAHGWTIETINSEMGDIDFYPFFPVPISIRAAYGTPLWKFITATTISW